MRQVPQDGHTRPGTAGACGRMSFLTESMPNKSNNEEVKAPMGRYKDAPSRHAADAIAKVSGVKNSERSRLPYFNSVNIFLADPRHVSRFS